MTQTITIDYSKSDINESFVIWRILQEVLINKPNGVNITIQIIAPAKMRIDLECNLIEHESFIFYLFRKRRELNYLIGGVFVLTCKKSPRRGEISLEKIEEIITDYFRLKNTDLQICTRKTSIKEPRQIAMFFSTIMTKESLATIGEYFGNKDHATCLHAKKRINNLIDTDKHFRAQISEIEKRLKQA